MLSVPTRPGKYPAILTVPGAGVSPVLPARRAGEEGSDSSRDRDPRHPRRSRLAALQRAPRDRAQGLLGVPASRTATTTTTSASTSASSAPATYRLAAEFDGSNYAVEGGSQGGALTLRRRHPRPAGERGGGEPPSVRRPVRLSSTARTSGWPFMLSDTAHLVARREKMATIPYYDTVNFARLLKVPGDLHVGLQRHDRAADRFICDLQVGHCAQGARHREGGRARADG